MNEILQAQDFNPQELINHLKTALNLNQVYQQKVRHYTLERHTFLIISEFEKYFENYDLPISKSLFRLMLGLHDIGKPQAFEEGNKNKQYQYTTEIINNLRNTLPFSASEIDLCIILVSSDVLGLYLQNKINLETAKNKIVASAQKTNLPILAFCKLMTVYYQCDTGSYTIDAGGFAFLEHLFVYQDGKKVFDNTQQRLKFSPNFETRFTELEKSLSL